MSGNGEQIDLNSEVDMGAREFEAHGIDLSHPVTVSVNEQSNGENRSGETGEDEAIQDQETNSFGEGLCGLDKGETDGNVGNEAVDVEFLQGRSMDDVKGTEMDPPARKGEASSMAINDLSELEMESSKRKHTSEKVEAVCRDEIIVDDNEVVNADGTLNASPSDALACCEAKSQVGEGLASLNESTEGGAYDDATAGDGSIISVGIEYNVESQEEGRTMQDEDEKVTENEELYVKHDQVVNEDDESHSVLDHKGCVDERVNTNPEGPFQHKDVDGSGSLHDNLASGSPKSDEDRIQSINKLDQKAENMTERNEVPPELATEVRTVPTSNYSENQSGKVDGGQTIENPATGSHIGKTGPSTDIDESKLFDIVVEVNPHVSMDEDDMSDDDSEDTVVKFNVHDLIWSRVPSHPWWPGQICDPAASSKKAMKYFKTGKYLVAFFGDHTFAWKEAVMIKPFSEYFSELQKQSNSGSFHDAIDCALEEFSRRVEFSLACPCLSEELYSKLQTQTLANGGIRKKLSKRVGGDSSLTASSFDPMKLINFVKEVAMSPSAEADKLEVVRAEAQLMALSRWKGYSELSKYDKHSAAFNDTDHILDVKNDDQSDSMVDIAIDIKDDEVAKSRKGSLKIQDISGGKCKRKSEDLKDSSKKGSNSTSKKPRRSGKKELGSKEDADNELNFPVSITKDEVVSCNNTAINSPITNVESGKKTNQSFRVGDRIRKVAYKLNELNPILKHDDGLSQKSVSKTRRGRKRKGSSELVSGVKTGNKSTKTRKRRKVSAPIETSDSEFIKDAYWTDRLIQGIAEDEVTFENQNETEEGHIQTPSETVIPTELVEPDSETCVEDPSPTALILTFTGFDSVPSETSLNGHI
ncbi:putative oxidoreductase GLYR1, partial [Cucurbita argyrosperma subsp. sororia]